MSPSLVSILSQINPVYPLLSYVFLDKFLYYPPIYACVFHEVSFSLFANKALSQSCCIPRPSSLIAHSDNLLKITNANPDIMQWKWIVSQTWIESVRREWRAPVGRVVSCAWFIVLIRAIQIAVLLQKLKNYRHVRGHS
jgi:hypothetical protein